VVAAVVAAADRPALPVLGSGYSYRRAYRPETYAHRAHIGVLEIVAEHFMYGDAESDRELDLLAEHFTLVPHGLDLSLGSADGVDEAYVERFAALVERVRAPWWSEHVAFTRAGDVRIGHLAPLPFTDEALDVLARNLQTVRRRLGDVPCALENIAAPFVLPGATMSEAEFLTRLVERTGCGLLLDVENVSANAVNFGGDAEAFMDALPADAVVQLHVAGGEWIAGTYVDSHARPISEGVWNLVASACRRFPIKAIVVERDERLPPFAELLAEIERARAIGEATGKWR
jgi:uncharacterized protein (UPF0276 family)